MYPSYQKFTRAALGLLGTFCMSVVVTWSHVKSGPLPGGHRSSRAEHLGEGSRWLAGGWQVRSEVGGYVVLLMSKLGGDAILQSMWQTSCGKLGLLLVSPDLWLNAPQGLPWAFQ